MRYLYLLFFLLLGLHSHFVFSQEPPPLPSCATTTGLLYCRVGGPDCAQASNQCIGSSDTSYFKNEGTEGIFMAYRCQSQCTCPPPSTWYKGIDVNGNAVSGCSNPSGGDTGGDDDSCPSGYPKVDGQCAVCPSGYNDDGTCKDPTACSDGETKQGEINGTAVCTKDCPDPAQSYGFVNGVEGCYGAPTCPNGGSYGTVNGVSGCYGGGGSGDGSGDGSGGAGGSSGGDGSGGAGGSSGGAGGSSGGDGGNGGDGSGGNNGGGNGGGGGGSNNDIGSNFGESEECPSGKIKLGNVCVSDGRGDCPVNYHELVVSRDPYLFICVPDDPPPSSSSASASSQPSSSSSEPSSSAASQSQASNSAASGGAGGSSGSGGGGGGGAGDGDSGSGDCDPTGADYFKCAGLLEELKNDDLQEMYQNIDDTNSDSLSDYEKLLTDDLQDFDEEGGVSFATNETNALKSLMSSFLPVASPCNPPTFNIMGHSHQLDCTHFNTFKSFFGWFLAVFTAFQIWQMAIRPVER